MGNSWTDDVDDQEDSSDDSADESSEKPFSEQLSEALDSREVGEISELELVNNVDDVNDSELLREAWLELDGERANIIENRIEDVTGAQPVDEEDPEPSESGNTDSGSGWGGSGGDDDSDGSDSDESSDETEAAEPAVESVEEIEDESEADEDESAESESSGGSGNASGPPQPANAMSVDEAADTDRRWKIMVWGPPKLFKTHFCYTMPEPIAFIDLEGKADDLAGKFAGKDIQVWQPKNMTAEPDTKFRRAKKALDEALEWLDWHYENNDVVGSIVVDSMSLMWEWAQIHHKLENYPLKDEEEIDLSSNFNSSQESDWAVVKEYHNGEFRERITDSRYHFCWTAMERVDFEKQMDGDTDNSAQFMEPTGEPKNTYKADTIIHARKDSDRGKVGDLTGSNFTDNVFVGLGKPTFPKVRDAIEMIGEAEAGDDSVSRSQLANKINAEALIDHDPQEYVQT